MYCSCGDNVEMSRSDYPITTLDGALRWVSVIYQDMLPLRMQKHTCKPCGRLSYNLTQRDGKVVRML